LRAGLQRKKYAPTVYLIILFDSIMRFVKIVTCHINRFGVKENVRKPNAAFA